VSVDVEGATRRVLIVIGTAATDGATIAALRLAEAALRRGDAVTVYAYGGAVRIGADGCPTSVYVQGLLGADAPNGRAAWIVDRCDPRTSTQVSGVRLGDGGDLWRLIREADVVLGVSP